MPEQTGDLNPVGEMLGIALVEIGPDRQPEIDKDQDASEHMQPMQSRDRKISGEIGAEIRQEHPGELDVFLVDVGDLVSGVDGPEVRAIGLGVGRFGVDLVERDFVLVDVRIVQRVVIMQMARYFDPRLLAFRQQVLVSEVRLVFLKRLRFDAGAEVDKFFRPFVTRFYPRR